MARAPDRQQQIARQLRTANIQATAEDQRLTNGPPEDEGSTHSEGASYASNRAAPSGGISRGAT